MGKDLKGKELGVGICQTKDKKYVARITTRNGKRVKRVFDKLVDCKKWIAEATECDFKVALEVKKPKSFIGKWR